MSRFYDTKRSLREALLERNWEKELDRVQGENAQEYIAPLLSLLPHSGELHWRAVRAFGLCVASLAERNLESGRVVLRRLMWHMNEESGNIGWGIPESMAEVLSLHNQLAEEFNRVLFSYVLDTGGDDNFVDHAPLLRSCFWAAGRLAQARPDYGIAALPSFLQGLEHEDTLVRCQAGLALCKLLKAAGSQKIRTALERAELRSTLKALEALKEAAAECEDFDGKRVLSLAPRDIAEKALALLSV